MLSCYDDNQKAGSTTRAKARAYPKKLVVNEVHVRSKVREEWL
jgi:hypothetical protein